MLFFWASCLQLHVLVGRKTRKSIRLVQPARIETMGSGKEDGVRNSSTLVLSLVLSGTISPPPGGSFFFDLLVEGLHSHNRMVSPLARNEGC